MIEKNLFWSCSVVRSLYWVCRPRYKLVQISKPSTLKYLTNEHARLTILPLFPKGRVLYWDLNLMLRLRRPDNFKSDFVYTSIFIQKSRPFCLILNKNSTLDLLFCRKTDVLKNMRRNWVSISKAKYFSLIKEGLWIFFR